MHLTADTHRETPQTPLALCIHRNARALDSSFVGDHPVGDRGQASPRYPPVANTDLSLRKKFRSDAVSKKRNAKSSAGLEDRIQESP
jgi:hypothetical protein